MSGVVASGRGRCKPCPDQLITCFSPCIYAGCWGTHICFEIFQYFSACGRWRVLMLACGVALQQVLEQGVRHGTTGLQLASTAQRPYTVALGKPDGCGKASYVVGKFSKLRICSPAQRTTGPESCHTPSLQRHTGSKESNTFLTNMFSKGRMSSLELRLQNINRLGAPTNTSAAEHRPSS